MSNVFFLILAFLFCLCYTFGMAKGVKIPIVDGLKLCQGCNQWKELGEFYVDPKNKYGVRSPCKECTKKTSRGIYNQPDSVGKRQNARNIQKRTKLKRQLVQEFGGKCIRCGYNRSVAAIDFHHANGDKKHNVNKLLLKAAIHNGEHLQIARTEASKCVLLCSNCHRELHAGEWQL